MALRVDDVDLVRDRALVERFQLGDSAAFETLYRRYFGRLVRFCQKRVGDPLEAEEIAQEAFTRALRAMPSFEGDRRFYPWMTVIAGRLCVDAHRRRGRSEPSPVIDLGVIDGGQERIVDAVDVEILSEALGRLATRHREVLDLREQQGWSYQQIADQYGVSLGTIEALLFRARKALKREFLAAVGDERNWAAVPVFGIIFRRLASWKARLDAAAPALPSLAGPVAAGVIAITAVSGVVGVAIHDRPDTGSTAVVRPMTSLEPVGLTAATPGPAFGAPSAPSGGTITSGPAAGGASRPSDSVAAPRVDTPVVDSVGSDRADDSAPVAADVGGVFVRVDPAGTIAKASTHLEDYSNQTEIGAQP